MDFNYNITDIGTTRPSTIYALSTFYGKSGVAVFRISGKYALQALQDLGVKIDNIIPRRAHYCRIMNIEEDFIIDNVIAIYFNAPHSFTGEEVVEIHSHGSIAVINAIFDVLSKLPYMRQAEPGEFASRAFLNDKMDLTQAEGLADLIDAETNSQLKLANIQISGVIKELYDNWRKKIIDILALVEAYIDFPEEDIPDDVIDDANAIISSLIGEMDLHINSKNSGEKIRSGIKLVIIGEPNVGKSTLMNCLAKKDVAITSNVPGTTRDAIETYIDIGGYPFIITDTAGIRESDDPIEKIGIEIAKKKYQGADLVIELYSSENLMPMSDNIFSLAKEKLVVINKADLINKQEKKSYPEGAIFISAKDGDNIEELIELLVDFAKRFDPSENNIPIMRARYREHILAAIMHLKEFDLKKPIELAAYDLRLAANEIAKITGIIRLDDVLDVVFSSFCIGK